MDFSLDVVAGTRVTAGSVDGSIELVACRPWRRPSVTPPPPLCSEEALLQLRHVRLVCPHGPAGAVLINAARSPEPAGQK